MADATTWAGEREAATAALSDPDDGADGSALVRVTDLQFAWPGRPRFAIAVERFAIENGERVLLLGPSGGGKSTLLSLLAGIVTPQRGCIEILGTDLAALGGAARDRFRAAHIGIVFQMFNLLPYGSVIDNVVLPLSFAPSRKKRVEARGAVGDEAARLLSRLGLAVEDFASHRAASLSVGQQQRVAAARALIGAPELIIADEPTSALDTASQDEFLSLLFEEIAEAGSGLLMVSHDERLAGRFDRVVRLQDFAKIERGRR